MSSRNVSGFVWLAIVGTGAAYENWFAGIQHLSVSTVSFLGLLSPLVATIVGWALMAEDLSAMQLAGAMLALVAVIGSQFGRGSNHLSCCDECVVGQLEDDEDDGSGGSVDDADIELVDELAGLQQTRSTERPDGLSFHHLHESGQGMRRTISILAAITITPAVVGSGLLGTSNKRRGAESPEVQGSSRVVSLQLRSARRLQSSI